MKRNRRAETRDNNSPEDTDMIFNICILENVYPSNIDDHTKEFDLTDENQFYLT